MPGVQKPALQAVVGVQRLLHGVQRAGRGHPLDGRDVGPLDLDGEHETRPHRPPVEHHRAGPTGALLARHVGAGQAEAVTEGVAQQGAALDGESSARRRRR